MFTSMDQTLIILIPTAAVGLIIGKAGQFLKYIGHISGAQLRLQAFDDMAPGTKERALFVTGDAAVIQSAMQIIMLRLQTQLTSAQSEQLHQHAMEVGTELDKLVVQWIIPQSATGLLIGKNGTRIKMINERSGAWVKIAHPEETAPGAGERYVYIRGTAAQTATAVDIVRSIAGGRASNADDKTDYRTTVIIPLRAIHHVMAGRTEDGDFHLTRLRDDVLIKVDSPFLTGISSAKIIIDGPRDARGYIEREINERLNKWNEVNSFNTLHNLAVIAGSEGMSPGSEEDNELRVKVEMCIVILVASQCADLLETVDEMGRNAYTPVIEKYGVNLEIVHENLLSAAYGSHTRVIAMVGPLGSLLHALEPLQAIMFGHHPHPVLPPHQQPPAHKPQGPNERSRRNLSPEELQAVGEQNRQRALAAALTSGDSISSSVSPYGQANWMGAAKPFGSPVSMSAGQLPYVPRDAQIPMPYAPRDVLQYAPRDVPSASAGPYAPTGYAPPPPPYVNSAYVPSSFQRDRDREREREQRERERNKAARAVHSPSASAQEFVPSDSSLGRDYGPHHYSYGGGGGGAGGSGFNNNGVRVADRDGRSSYYSSFTGVEDKKPAATLPVAYNPYQPVPATGYPVEPVGIAGQRMSALAVASGAVAPAKPYVNAPVASAAYPYGLGSGYHNSPSGPSSSFAAVPSPQALYESTSSSVEAPAPRQSYRGPYSDPTADD